MFSMCKTFEIMTRSSSIPKLSSFQYMLEWWSYVSLVPHRTSLLTHMCACTAMRAVLDTYHVMSCQMHLCTAWRRRWRYGTVAAVSVYMRTLSSSRMLSLISLTEGLFFISLSVKLPFFSLTLVYQYIRMHQDVSCPSIIVKTCDDRFPAETYRNRVVRWLLQQWKLYHSFSRTVNISPLFCK